MFFLIFFQLLANFSQTLRGSFSAGWQPDYPQKLKVPEGYEKINDNSNIGHETADSLIAKESFTGTLCTATYSAIQTASVREE